MARAILCGLVFGGFSGHFVQSSAAALFTLTDKNSVAKFDTATQANNFNWQVDGVNQLTQQAFWYRIGSVAEQSVHSLPISVQGVSDTNFDGNPDTLFVRYFGGGFQIDTNYHLQGGSAGSGAADMGEQLAITNSSSSPLDFHFFQYANFDLQAAPAGDSAVFTNANTVDQYKGTIRLTETVVTPPSSHREIAFFNSTLLKLNDAVATTLSDTPIGTVVGPGDMTWAYQWDFLIPGNTTVQISKDKNLKAVPEPAAGSLLSLAAGLLLAGYRKRRVA